VLQGFAKPPQDTTTVVAALLAQATQRQGADEEVARVSEFFLANNACALSSAQTLSAALNVDRRTLRSVAHGCAATVCCLQHARLNMLEVKLAQGLPRAYLVHYVEAVQYDETPMRTRIVGDRLSSSKTQTSSTSSTNSSSAGSAVMVPPSRSTQLALSEGQARSLSVSARSAPQTIVQTRGSVGFVLRLGERFVSVTREHFPLAVLERTTAQSLKHLQLILSRVGPAAKAFKGYTRAATTDAFLATFPRSPRLPRIGDLLAKERLCTFSVGCMAPQESTTRPSLLLIATSRA